MRWQKAIKVSAVSPNDVEQEYEREIKAGRLDLWHQIDRGRAVQRQSRRQLEGSVLKSITGENVIVAQTDQREVRGQEISGSAMALLARIGLGRYAMAENHLIVTLKSIGRIQL